MSNNKYKYKKLIEIDSVLICSEETMIQLLSMYGAKILRENLTEDGIKISAEEFLKQNKSKYFL